MIKIAVCDDSISISSEISRMISKTAKQRFINVDCDLFTNGRELLHKAIKETEYDILFLDIEMPEIDGIEVARLLRRHNNLAIIIYISNHSELAKDLFQVEPFRFLQKPISKNKFETYFIQAYNEIIKHSESFVFSFKKEIFRLKLKNIMYFSSNKRKIMVHTAMGIEEYYERLDNIEAKLKISKIPFIRIHQSFLVNFLYVESFKFKSVTLKNGETLLISEDRQKDIRLEFFHLFN